MEPNKKQLIEAGSDIAAARNRMSDQEFKDYIGGIAVIALGVMYEEEGRKFYKGFLQGALKNPQPIRFEKATMQ